MPKSTSAETVNPVPAAETVAKPAPKKAVKVTKNAETVTAPKGKEKVKVPAAKKSAPAKAKVPAGKRGPRQETLERINTALVSLGKHGLANGNYDKVIADVMKKHSLEEKKAQAVVYKMIYVNKWCTWRQDEDLSETLTITAAGKAALKELNAK